MCIVALISSYICWASLIFVLDLCNFGFSYKVSHNSMALFKRKSQPLTAFPTVVMCSFIDALCFSLAFGGVVGSSFNYNSTIFMWKSILTLPVSHFDLRTIVANFMTFVVVVMSSGICKSWSDYTLVLLLFPGSNFVVLAVLFLSKFEPSQ